MGLVTGVAMAKSGLPLSIAVLMSLSVFAASAQLAAVPLMLVGAPLWMVWLTAACVNLRFVIFSVQMRPHMMTLPMRWRLMAGYLTADVTYVLSVHRYEGKAPASNENLAPLVYFVGLARSIGLVGTSRLWWACCLRPGSRRRGAWVLREPWHCWL